MANYTSLTSDKNKDTALKLCIFGGIIGLHQYYVGNIKKGILYSFTMGLFMIGYIFDVFKILLGTFRDNAGMPLRARKKDYDKEINSIPTSINIVKQSSENNVDVAEQLKKLADLKDSGVLTEEEFNNQKAKLLSI